MLVVGEKGGGGKSTQRILFYFLNLNTQHIVLTPSLCRNPTGENLLCQCTAQVSRYWITCSTLYFPVNTHPLKTLFHNLSLLHIWIVLLQSYSLWLSNILQDQMERDGEMNGQVGGVIRGESRATAPSKDTTIPRGYLLSSEFLSLFSCWTWEMSASVSPRVHGSSFTYTIVLKPKATVWSGLSIKPI